MILVAVHHIFLTHAMERKNQVRLSLIPPGSLLAFILTPKEAYEAAG